MRSSVISQVWSIARVGTISDRRGDRLRSISAGSFSCRCAYIAKVLTEMESRFDGEHENKDLRINSRILLFGMGNVFRRRSADAHAEPERGEVENHDGNYERHPRVLFEHLTSDGIDASGKPIHVAWT